MPTPCFAFAASAFLPRQSLFQARRLPWSTTRRYALSMTDVLPVAPEISTRPPRKRDQIDVVVSHLTANGAIGRSVESDFDVYLPKGACPGDTVRAIVTRVRRRESSQIDHLEAVYHSLITPSSTAIPVPCAHFGHFKLGGGSCGGCTAMHVRYEEQLREKQRFANELFHTWRKEGVVVSEIIPCENIWAYRNKMEFSFGKRWRTKLDEGDDGRSGDEYVVGLHAPQRFDKVIEIQKCYIQNDLANDILQYIRVRSKEMLLEPFDSRSQIGYMRNIAIRTSKNASDELEVMVNIITSPCDVPGRLKPLADELIVKFPSIRCVVQNIRGKVSQHAVDLKDQRLLAGQDHIEMQLGDLTFFVSPNSFFQTNTEQALVLYQSVLQAAKVTKETSVLDLFCGTGTIGLFLASHARNVLGIDIVSDAIEDASRNAKRNNIENASFEVANLDKIKKMNVEWNDIDVMVVDPPRAGLHPDLIKLLCRLSDVKRIVYVSCNIKTQVRDVHLLQQLEPGWRVVSIQPIDMFPHTSHMECVMTLERAPV